MMQGRVIYEYATIRLVPVVEREEFMNVGVILYSKWEKYLGIRFQINEARLKAFTEEVAMEDVQKYLHAWKLVCEGGKTGGIIGEMDLPSRFRWLTASRSTIIQSSSVHPGLCTDPEEVLERLFKTNVL